MCYFSFYQIVCMDCNNYRLMTTLPGINLMRNKKDICDTDHPLALNVFGQNIIHDAIKDNFPINERIIVIERALIDGVDPNFKDIWGYVPMWYLMNNTDNLKMWDDFLRNGITTMEFESNILSIARVLLNGNADPNLIEDFYFYNEYPGLLKKIISYLNDLRTLPEIKEPGSN
jgi:hypothetical protein